MGKVSVRASSKWSNLPNFHLGVSMGSRHHSGQALMSIVEWANEYGFSHGLIDISDTLNRYNHMMTGMSEKEAFEVTRREGLRWRLENRHILEKLKMPYDMVHWDHWLKDPRFLSYERSFHNAFDTNPAFRVAVMKDIQHHYLRKYDQNLHERSSADIELSKRFYLEELAVLSIQFEDYPCAEAYPGRELECVKLVRSGSVRGVPAGIENAVYAKLFIHDVVESPKAKSEMAFTL